MKYHDNITLSHAPRTKTRPRFPSAKESSAREGCVEHIGVSSLAPRISIGVAYLSIPVDHVVEHGCEIA
jgi:hypothetical protein